MHDVITVLGCFVVEESLLCGRCSKLNMLMYTGTWIVRPPPSEEEDEEEVPTMMGSGRAILQAGRLGGG